MFSTLLFHVSFSPLGKIFHLSDLFSWFLKSLLLFFLLFSKVLPETSACFKIYFYILLDIQTILFVFFCMFVLSLMPLTTPKKFPFFVFILLCFWTFSFSLSWMSVFPLFLLNNFLHFVSMSCWLADLLIKPPTAFLLLGTGVLWCPCRTHRCDDSFRQDDESPKRQPYSAALYCTDWHSWRVHLQHYQTWPMLCTHLTTQENQTKLRRDLTWLCMAGKLNWSWRAPPQPCEYTFAFTVVPLKCSLDFRLVHSVLSRYFSASLYCEVHVLPDSHHLLSLDFHHLAGGGKFVLQLGLQLASALPSLLALTWPLRFNIDHGLLDLPRHSLPRRYRFQLHSRFVTCRRLRFSSHFGHGTSWSWTCDNSTAGAFRHSVVLHLFLWMNFYSFVE